ncbi:DUF4132 domain-containing protein [Actinoallomurus purpureus]|uniref:DUF4132 domain-containing protein n=1 Tax=Actinoallomurus purpureus TaxID=478114 RepID=UPI002092A8BF|nr:DUF4132 domain-containing protein [Actinoallomurus purpureus]MCO6007441.1 DUF4132 domain-containing protein [Actinoallomurus purpureus]
MSLRTLISVHVGNVPESGGEDRAPTAEPVPTGRVVAAEDALAGVLDGDARAALALIRARSFGSPPDRDDWERLADSAYAGFARAVLETAAARAAAIQAGEIPYVADKAFTAEEVAALGRAFRVALLRDDTWLPELLDRLLPAVAVAPTPARTLPSQALVFELARSAQEFPTPEAAAALRAVRGIVRHAGVPKQLDRSLKRIDAALADRTEVAFRLPDLGFGPDGVHRRVVGEYEARVTAGDDVTLTWHRSDGQALRGVPAAVRRDHPARLKELRQLVKRARAHLTTLTRALEGALLAESGQAYGRWRAEQAGHPLGRSLIERLIWEVEVAPGEWRAGLPVEGGRRFLDAAGEPWAAVGEDSAVRLWHPVRAAPGEIRAWRDELTERRLRQPFKQAFREIYLLTPAERETRVYSNRFAAHILRYRRLYALFKARGWQAGMLGPWDGGHEGEATRVLPGRRWRARFFVEYTDLTWQEELAATDQVRFERRTGDGWREAALEDVPPTVFSEVMRDVDLFVGVTSIAADPEWTDRGEDRFRDYWHRAGFGDLSASAEVRRDALARLLPRTRIADRAELTGRFLRVRGSRRTYRIHLGSANILMEPDDAYLCVVASSGGAADGLFLPFEDERLSLILSKAFLLADDAGITDPDILRQIERGV